MTEFFHRVLLPTRFTEDAAVSLQYRTEIVESGSGFEFRNNLWTAPRRTYLLPTRICPIDEARAFEKFYNERRGKLYGFLINDRLDNISSTGHHSRGVSLRDQELVPLDDSRRVFGLRKKYKDGRLLDITKPWSGNFHIGRNGRPLRFLADFTFSTLTGRVTFTTPQPQSARLTAGFFFYRPVRFDNDNISFTYLSRTHARIDEIRLVELYLTHSHYDEV